MILTLCFLAACHPTKKIMVEDYCLIYKPVCYPIDALKLAPREQKLNHKDNNDYYTLNCLKTIKPVCSI